MRFAFGKSNGLPDGAALYGAIVAETRRPDWYAKAGVEDVIDGRFAVLATLLALTDVRLEQGGEAARAAAPRLAEAFIADMDAQMREAGFGDPSLGKQVRHLVGSLASRVDRWRRAVDGEESWEDVARASLYRDSPPGGDELARGIAAARAWWDRLRAADDAQLIGGRIA